MQNAPESLKEVSRSVTARLGARKDKAARKAGKGAKKVDVDAGYETLSEGSAGGAHSQACALAMTLPCTLLECSPARLPAPSWPYYCRLATGPRDLLPSSALRKSALPCERPRVS